MNNLPKHIAIIMDGNGRWAMQRKLPRMLGHREGGKAVEKIIEACAQKGISVLTLFAFSTENWDRPQEEVDYLMQLFLDALSKEVKRLHKNNVKLRVIGGIDSLNEQLRAKISSAEQLTSANTGLKLNLAINYSGRWDIFQATYAVAKMIEAGELKVQKLTQELFQSKLCLADLPPPDLFIRTSGELRISNFLLWQLAYTELYFTKVLWPDFDESALNEALAAYATRERRFGGINSRTKSCTF
jgi:undecaprenyl diphosphate synthase